MADPTVSIGDSRPDVSTAMGVSMNEIAPLDPNMFRRPDYLVHIYSLADRELIRELPPQLRRLIIPGRGNKRYTKVTDIPHPFNQLDDDGANHQVTRYHDGRRIAMDIVNPANTSLNQDAAINPKESFSEGNDYGKLGVFWSINEPPTEEEILAAEKRKENHYRRILKQAEETEVSNPVGLQLILTPDHHMAADFFEQEYNWHKSVKRPVECKICGAKMKPNAPWHAIEGAPGALCISNWKLAVSSGIRKKEDVPDELRWWKE